MRTLIDILINIYGILLTFVPGIIYYYATTPERAQKLVDYLNMEPFNDEEKTND